MDEQIIPGTLLEPPPPGKIVTLQVTAARWYRVHPFDEVTRQYLPDAFNDSTTGDARFSPLLRTSKKVIPTLYAAASDRAAIAEVVLRNLPVPSAGYLHDLRRDLESNLRLSTIELAELTLANLTTTGMSAAGLPPYMLVDGGRSNYLTTRKWAKWIWETQPNTQGLFWMSRRYNRDAVIVLFEDRILEPIQVVSSYSISAYSAEIVEVLAEMGAGIIPVI